MKKIFLTFILSIIGISVSAQESIYPKVFITRFFHCFPAHVSFVKDDATVTVVTSWWKDSRCRFYMETKNSKEDKKYYCHLTRAQVTEFANAMKKDPSGDGQTKILLEKYKKDQNTCSLEN